MQRDHLTDLYDDGYAAAYEEKFIFHEITKSDAMHELTLIEQFLADGGTWLDVACGTGFFLRHFPAVDRAGLDLSPAMLRRAREGNPGIPLVLHDFREPLAAWEGRWDFVSCMWYAYGLVDTVTELQRLVHNLWSWTSTQGTCFVPLADPGLMTGVQLPHHLPSMMSETGRVEIVGIVWSYIEDGGTKVHQHQLAPNLDFMVESFSVYFEQVQIIRYPPAFPGWQGRPALIATKKRSLANVA